jgi:hypothetical protein
MVEYEELRKFVLSQGAGENPTPGLALLLHQGMAAWMRAWSGCRKTQHTQTLSPPTANSPCSLDVRGEVASILAAIILNRQLEAHT